MSSDVDRVLDSVELTTQRAQQIRDQKFGNLVIATYPDIAIDFLPRIVSRFREGRPELRVTIMARRSEMIRGLLPTQLYDLAVVDWPIEHPSVEIEEFEFQCVCALPDGHLLAGQKTIGPRDLDGLPFISLLPEHMIYSQTESAFTGRNAHWNVAIETQTMESVSAFIRQGAGVGLLDPLTAQRYIHKGIVVRRFEPAVTYSIALLLPRDRLRSTLLDKFIRALKLEFDGVKNLASWL